MLRRRSLRQATGCLPNVNLWQPLLWVVLTIREAIRHFQALGVIETRMGSGTYL